MHLVPGFGGAFCLPALEAFAERRCRNPIAQYIYRRIEIFGHLLRRRKREFLRRRVQIGAQNMALLRDLLYRCHSIPLRCFNLFAIPILAQKVRYLFAIRLSKKVQLPCVDKEHPVACGGTVYNPCAAGDLRSVKEACRKRKDRFNPAVKKYALSNLALCRILRCQCSIRQKCNCTSVGGQVTDDVLEPRKIGVFARGIPVFPMCVPVRSSVFTPIRRIKRWV